MQTDHEVIARELILETRRTPPPLAKNCARQGDVVLERMGDCRDTAGCSPAPSGGWLMARGAHGDHRLFADLGLIVGDTVTLPNGGVVVHTDVPNARHGAIALAPGMWAKRALREMLGNEIVKVQD